MSGRAADDLTLSIVIPNYNYSAYVAAAIESALAIDWPSVEIIVVDDGSTDDSWRIISEYSGRIHPVRQVNAGPREACNAGFALSSGDVVIFLDSDDRLLPGVMRAIADVWDERVSKVQYAMRRIDRGGHSLGSTLPKFRSTPTPAEVRRWADATCEYPSPPGSGNAYPRTFLAQLLPLGPDCGDATDSALLAAAPYLGDVMTVRDVQAEYRVHGDNRSRLLRGDQSALPKYIDRALQRHRFALRTAGRETEGLGPLLRGLHLLQLRVAARRLHGDVGALPGDTRAGILRDVAAAVLASSYYTPVARAAIAVWVGAVAVAPRRVAHGLIRRRFAVAS